MYSKYFKALLLCLALAFSTAVSAEETHAETVEFCSMVSVTGEEIMRAYQSGVPMDMSMTVAVDPDHSESMQDVLAMLVTWAYGTTRYTTEAVRERAVIDFRSDVFRRCYTARTQ